jgi:hypothetical protein
MMLRHLERATRRIAKQALKTEPFAYFETRTSAGYV